MKFLTHPASLWEDAKNEPTSTSIYYLDIKLYGYSTPQISEAIDYIVNFNQQKKIRCHVVRALGKINSGNAF